jgi:hypothetical protein
MVEAPAALRRWLPGPGTPIRRGLLPVLAAAAVAWVAGELVLTQGRTIGVAASGWMALGAMALAAAYAVRRRFRLLSLYLIRPFVVVRPLRRFRTFVVRLDELRNWRVVHLWIGTLFLLPLYWHVQDADGGLLERFLLATIVVVVMTGLAGVALQYLLPQAMLRSAEREVRARDVRERQRALFVAAEEQILGRSDALVDAYLRVLRPVLDGEPSRRRLLVATLRGTDPGEIVRARIGSLGAGLEADDAAIFAELSRLTERKVRLDLNSFQLEVTTGWLVFHAGAVACGVILLLLHLFSIAYFGGL